MFSKLKTKRKLQQYKTKELPVGSQIYKAMLDANLSNTKGNHPQLRPSSFPICPIKTWLKLQESMHLGYFEGEDSFAASYFTSVGTLVHELIQYYIGDSLQIYGNWQCTNKNCKYHNRIVNKHTTNNICPHCNSRLSYSEIEVTYKGIKGHIDCIIQLPNNRYWVMDYKTCTTYKIDNVSLPYRSNLRQASFYATAFRKQFKKKVVGFSLFYLSRDNPFKFKECDYKYSKEWEDLVHQRITLDYNAFKACIQTAKQHLTPSSINNLIDNKPCQTKEDYKLDYGNIPTECPFLDVCFDRPKLVQRIKSTEQNLPIKSRKLLKVVQLPAIVQPKKE